MPNDHFLKRKLYALETNLNARSQIRSEVVIGSARLFGGRPVGNIRSATRLVRQKRGNGVPFKVREFIPHDLRLSFGRLNYVRTYPFNRQNWTTGTSVISP